MLRRIRSNRPRLVLGTVTLVLVGALLAGSAAVAGRSHATSRRNQQVRLRLDHWRALPAAPIAGSDVELGAWTGKELLVFVRVRKRGAHGEILESANRAVAYEPQSRTWRQLATPLLGPAGYPGRWSAVWSGSELIVLGDVNQALTLETGSWRRLPDAPAGRNGIAVWTGRELVEWGGGCCGDASSDGAAFDPRTDKWRTLPPAPVGGQVSPLGAWTGRELVVLDGRDPEGNRVAGAAYDPQTDKWRRIAPMPAVHGGASATWTGREILVLGGVEADGKSTRVGFGYSPAQNRWRTFKTPRIGAGVEAIRAGKRILVGGLAFDPDSAAWSELPGASSALRPNQVEAWTGDRLLAWGGVVPTPVGTSVTVLRYPPDGAELRPMAHPARLIPPLPQCC